MTRYFSILLAFALAVAACQQQGEQAGTTEEAATAVDAAAIEQTIQASADAYEQASMAGDTEALTSLYSDDAIVMAPGMPRAEGIDAVRTAYQQMYAAGAPTTASIEPGTVFVSASGDVAYEAGSYTFTGTGPDGSEFTDSGKYLAVWKPNATGEWKIAVDIWNADAMPGAPADEATTTVE